MANTSSQQGQPEATSRSGNPEIRASADGAATTQSNGRAANPAQGGDPESQRPRSDDKTQPAEGEKAAPPDAGGGEKAGAAEDGAGSPRPSKKVIVIGSIVVAALLLAGIVYWLRSRGHESTDDAYITGHLHQISARVTGTVSEVLVEDNRHVGAGEILVQLDPRDYEVARQRAQAGLTQARASVVAARAALEQAKANVVAADANVSQAQAQETQAGAQFEKTSLDFNRDRELFEKKVVSKAEFDAARAAYEGARAAFEATKAGFGTAKGQAAAANAGETSARAQITVAEANVESAATALRDAELQLSYTSVVAPVEGRVSKKTVEAGQRLQPGQALMAVVEENVWVLANMKETQLNQIEVGQHVTIEIDALKGHKFSGKVDSIQAGSGATFALLPPDNATGNFTKIVQRVPVKIVFDDESIREFRDKIVPGLSAVPTIDLRSGPSADPAGSRRRRRAQP